LRNYKPEPVPDSVWQKPSHFIAFGFGSGAIPFAPGTFGTLVAVPIYLALQDIGLAYYILLMIAIIIGSSYLSDKVSKDTKTHDHQGMCLDEIVGFLVTMTAAPKGFWWIVFGFVLFRFFDIVKPWPINYIDKRVGGGFGMILDDVVAGIFSLIIIQITYYFI